MKLSTVDIFCGCGGLSLGFEKAGFHIEVAYDNWELALNCYRDNFTHEAYKMDLTDVNNSVSRIEKYKPEVIIGGPPCQDFSIAGNRIESHRANLTVAFAKIVSSISPELVVMENVSSIKKVLLWQRLLRF